MENKRKAAPRAFDFPAGPAGVLLIHGFTGAPAEMQPLGHYLHRRGCTVSAPLLPGHGTDPWDLNRRRWQEWYRHAEAGLADLQARCRWVFVAGLSMGSLLALSLVAGRTDIAGVVAYAPAVHVRDWRALLVPVVKYFLPHRTKSEPGFHDPTTADRLWAYDVNPLKATHEVLKLSRHTRRILPRISCPLLVVHSDADRVIHPRSPRYVHDRVASADKKLLLLERSSHVITLDAEWETAAEATYRFILRQVLGSSR